MKFYRHKTTQEIQPEWMINSKNRDLVDELTAEEASAMNTDLCEQHLAKIANDVNVMKVIMVIMFIIVIIAAVLSIRVL